MKIKHKFIVYLHNLFIKHPRVGWYGYELMRLIKSDSELKAFLGKIKLLGFQPGVILDIGANRGEWSQTVKSVFASSTFYMIEPQSEMEPFLSRACANNVAKNSAYFIAGAGSEPGELEIAIWDNFAGTSIMAVETAEAERFEKRLVPIVTVDGLVRDERMAVPSLIKVDVQGFELEVIKGAVESLSECELIILEVSLFRFFPSTPLVHEVIAFMGNLGYVVYDFLNLRKRPCDGALGQVDICFAKSNGIFRKTNNW